MECPSFLTSVVEKSRNQVSKTNKLSISKINRWMWVKLTLLNLNMIPQSLIKILMFRVRLINFRISNNMTIIAIILTKEIKDLNNSNQTIVKH